MPFYSYGLCEIVALLSQMTGGGGGAYRGSFFAWFLYSRVSLLLVVGVERSVLKARQLMNKCDIICIA